MWLLIIMWRKLLSENLLQLLVQSLCAKAAGYDPVDSVTDALALLIAADPNAASAKISDAKRLSVPIQSLDLWLGSVKNFVPKKEEPDKSDQMTFDF